MSIDPGPVRRCTIFRGRGEAVVQTVDLAEDRELPIGRMGVAARTPIRRIMSRDLICARADLAIGAVIELMVERHIGCIPVVDELRRPIGVITKWDVVEQVGAAMRCCPDGSPLPVDLAPRVAEEVMMPLALTLDEDATVGSAAAMMTLEDTHHVLVVSTAGTLVGVVSAKDIVRWLVENDGLASMSELRLAGPTLTGS